MNDNTSWSEVLVTFGGGFIVLLCAAFLISLTNPKIEANCAAKGGQILHRPGHLNSCIYFAK